MNIEDASILTMTNIDKTKLPPIQQKRILAFVNHFIISTCTFLNNFAAQCETRFLEIERKIQKVEAALIILEAKLSSINGLENFTNETNKIELEKSQNVENKTDDAKATTSEINEPDASITKPQVDIEFINEVKACDDIRYKKYFKMLQVGVPTGAVKSKMEVEGFDPNILDNPNTILQDGIKEETSSSSNS